MAKKTFSKITNFVGDLTGANDALDAQLGAGNQALALQKKIYDTGRTDTEAYRDLGLEALRGLKSDDFKRDFTMADFASDPGFQFRMQEGQKALERSAAARGGLMSGATLKGLTRFGQDFASNEYQNAYNRFNADRDRRFGRLSSLAGMGQNAVGQSMGVGQNFANQGSNIYGQMGNARAQNAMSGFNTLVDVGSMAAGAYFSDAALKENLEAAEVEIDELLEHLNPYSFKYKNEKHGKGVFYGILAQDLEKSKAGKTLIVQKDEGKAIDIEKTFHALLAVNSLLHKKIKDLETQIAESKNV